MVRDQGLTLAVEHAVPADLEHRALFVHRPLRVRELRGAAALAAVHHYEDHVEGGLVARLGGGVEELGVRAKPLPPV